MKLAAEQDLAGHHAATVRGAIEGVVTGFAISLPASFYLNRRWAYYRKLPIHLKALGVVMVVAPLYAVQAERRGVQYDKSTWSGAGHREMVRSEKAEQRRWEALGSKEKFRDWAVTNQYKVILGSWATSMIIAGGLVWGKKHQTSAQKVVQARMWAQGLTVGILIAAGILTHSHRKKAASTRSEDHSWVNMVEEHEKEERERLLRLPPPAPVHTS